MSKLGDLIKYYFPNEHDKLVNRGLEQDIITKSINNLELMKNMDREKIENIKNNGLMNLITLYSKGKIKNIELKKLDK